MQKSRISPRAGLSYKVTEKFSLRTSHGHYYQQPLFPLLETLPQNRALIPIRANPMVAGLTYIIGPTVRMTIEGYQKDYKDYPVWTQFPSISLASGRYIQCQRDIDALRERWARAFEGGGSFHRKEVSRSPMYLR